MTKDELANLVDLVYAGYNVPLPTVDKKKVRRAWYDILHDLDYIDAYDAYLDLATFSAFMPRPGDIRRATIDAQTKIPKHLEPYSAWGIFLGMQKDAHNGVGTKVPLPEAVQKTLERLGPSAAGMHTNGDRDVFVAVYKQVVSELELHKYKISENPTRGRLNPDILPSGSSAPALSSPNDGE